MKALKLRKPPLAASEVPGLFYGKRKNNCPNKFAGNSTITSIIIIIIIIIIINIIIIIIIIIIKE